MSDEQDPATTKPLTEEDKRRAKEEEVENLKRSVADDVVLATRSLKRAEDNAKAMATQGGSAAMYEIRRCREALEKLMPRFLR